MDYKWWQYDEADSYAGKIDIQNAANKKASLSVPSGAKPRGYYSHNPASKG